MSTDLDVVTLFILSQSAPEFSKADSDEQREAAQGVWRRHRDEALGACDRLDQEVAVGRRRNLWLEDEVRRLSAIVLASKKAPA